MSEQVVASQQTQKTTLSTKEVVSYLVEKFPLCFSLEGEAKPLKIGIFQELAEALAEDEKISKTLLRQALRAYTSNWRYLHGCREGAMRVGLQGEACGTVEADQAEHAAQTLAQAKAAYAEKRAEQLKQRAEQTKHKPKLSIKPKGHEKANKKSVEVRYKKPKMVRASRESLTALETKFNQH